MSKTSRTILKEGDILIATDECIMHLTGKKTLTIRKEYPIQKVFPSGEFRIKDDAGHDHLFETKRSGDGNWRKFFKRKKQ